MGLGGRLQVIGDRFLGKGEEEARRSGEYLNSGGGTVFFARTIVIATGTCYNKPTAVSLERFAGRGIHYGAYVESQLCEGEEVIVVGGGNSAGQAALFNGSAKI